MVKARDIFAGALAFEFGDVVLVVVGAVVIVGCLYVLEQWVEGEVDASVAGVANSITAPVTQFLGNLSGPQAGQSWTNYLGFGDD